MREKTVLIVEHAKLRSDGFVRFIQKYEPEVRINLWRCYEKDLPETTNHDAVILTGGYQMVGDLKASSSVFFANELRVIDSAVSSGIPILGVCLGSQILCDHLGGVVGPAEWIVGWHGVDITPDGRKDPLFVGVASFNTFQYHRDHLLTLPDGSIRLATSANSRYEAFRFGEMPVWGCVFHPEIEVDQIQSVFDESPELFTKHGKSRTDLSPLDDGHENRHAILANFLKFAKKN